MVCRHSDANFVPAEKLGAYQPAPKTFAGLLTFTPYFVGGLLLVAAALKAQKLIEGEQPATDIFASRWFMIVLVDVEALCGLALILGIWPTVTRRVSKVLFLGFLGFSAYRAAAGAKTCGCLGGSEATPLAMAILDLGVLAALWIWQPRQVAANSRFMLRGLAWLLTSSLVLVSSWLGLADAQFLVTVSPTLVDLGKLSQGKSQRFSVLLRNQQEVPVIITRIEASCPCLAWGQRGLALEALGKAYLELEIDLGMEPFFTGRLLIEARVWTEQATPAFVLMVQIEVEA
jgi:hypothetical protein